MSEFTQGVTIAAKKAHKDFTSKHGDINDQVFQAIFYSGVLSGLDMAKGVMIADKTVSDQLRRISA